MAGPSVNPYLPPTLVGYNANGPTNDGQQTPQNLVKWDFHLDNIGNPLVNYSGGVDSAALAAFGKTLNTDAGVHNAVGGTIGFDIQNTTISSDAITATGSNIVIDTESAAATDDLNTINASVTEGTILYLRSANAARVVTINSGVGNIILTAGGQIALSPTQPLEVFYDAGNWRQLTPPQIFSFHGVSGYSSSYAAQPLSVTTFELFRAPVDLSIAEEGGVLVTASLGQNVILDWTVNGTTIYSTKPQFAAGSTTLTNGTLSTSTIDKDDLIEGLITQVGTDPDFGEGLAAYLNCVSR